MLISPLTSQNAVFGIHDIDNDSFLIRNHILLLLLTLHIGNARKYGFLSFRNFLNKINKTKNLERGVVVNNWNKCKM